VNGLALAAVLSVSAFAWEELLEDEYDKELFNYTAYSEEFEENREEVCSRHSGGGPLSWESESDIERA